MSNLLVIDWDFFFPNPNESGDLTPTLGLYDWSHAETPMYIDVIWPVRAAGFLARQLPLPTVNDQWRTFWDRFTFAPDVRITTADSNAVAARNAGSYRQVWLYDAHHDSGYGIDSLQQWIERTEALGYVTCEDWMLSHLATGAELHYRFPDWHTHYRRDGVKVPDGVPLDAQVDTEATLPDVVFDDVFVCRSGAWVPPWCDAQLQEFLAAFPNQDDRTDHEDLVRDFDLAHALAESEVTRMFSALTTAGTLPARGHHQ